MCGSPASVSYIFKRISFGLESQSRCMVSGSSLVEILGVVFTGFDKCTSSPFTG